MTSPLLIIGGPTATGKTKLAMQLAKTLNGEIISADSRQVYQGMDIMTGKDIEEFKFQISDLRFGDHQLGYYTDGKIKIWGYDVVKPNEQWSINHFVRLANLLINYLSQQHKLPIIAGGSGLYLSSLLSPPATISIPPNPQLRTELSPLDTATLQHRLQKMNPSRWEKMNESDRNNPRRLIRAIEVAKSATSFRSAVDQFQNLQILVGDARRGAPSGAHSDSEDVGRGCTSGRTHALKSFETDPLSVFKIYLTAPAPAINLRIEQRARQRLSVGGLDEVRRLVEKYGWNSVVAHTIGYQEWKNYFAGIITYSEAAEKWLANEKQYARRQQTWFAKHPPDFQLNISDKESRRMVVREVRRWYDDAHGFAE